MSEREHSHFGQYEVVEVIQRSATSIVYKGYQPSLDRAVAIKVLLQSHDPQFAARFKREARAIGQLEHHNILPIYDYGEQDGQLFFVMQHVDHGFTLQDVLGEPMELRSALRLAVRVLDALNYAHRRRVIHRDIKPSNILLPLPEWPLLADFGIAKLTDEQQTLTMPGLVMGTALYMAPEHIAGQPADARTDLYSLGVVLYHTVTGRAPFAARTPLAVLQKHAYEPLPPPREARPDLPESVERIILRALAKDPAERYQTAQAMIDDIHVALASLEHSQQSEKIGPLYEAGMHAFGEGEWSVAIEWLQQVHALDPQYGETSELLAFAREAQQRAREEAQARLARLQRHTLPRHANVPVATAPKPRSYRTERMHVDEASEPPKPPAPVEVAARRGQTRASSLPRPLLSARSPRHSMLIGFGLMLALIIVVLVVVMRLAP